MLQENAAPPFEAAGGAEDPCRRSGYDDLLDALREWGITLCAGVTGGGVIHFLKHLSPIEGNGETSDNSGSIAFLSIGEYAAGFVPLGHFIASGRPAAAIATTGAATKLLCCGLSDAKLHDIPSVYLVPVAGTPEDGRCRLQDTSIYGSNIVAQLRAELPESIIMLDAAAQLGERLRRAGELLRQSKPVVLVLDHEALSTPSLQAVRAEQRRAGAGDRDERSIAAFVNTLRVRTRNRRLVVLAGEELGRYAGAPALTTRLCDQLAAPLVWSINGANGVGRDNRYGYGYVLFGGNDAASALWSSLGEDDVLLVLGACLDEYTVDLDDLNVGAAFFVTGLDNGYGQIDGSVRHRVRHGCFELHAPLDALLRHLIETSADTPFANVRTQPAPDNLNLAGARFVSDEYVDLERMYRMLDGWWPAGSIGIDDVCLAYKDRQYVTQRPHPHIRFYSFYRGSAMGGAFGAAVGAKLGAPASNVYLFTGDGCFRLIAGCLGEARQLGLVMFLLNNGKFSIVAQGLAQILPDVSPARHHAEVAELDYGAMARACGWRAEKVRSDLSNLYDILERCRRRKARSTLVEIPVDSAQVLGRNPRLRNL